MLFWLTELVCNLGSTSYLNVQDSSQIGIGLIIRIGDVSLTVDGVALEQVGQSAAAGSTDLVVSVGVLHDVGQVAAALGSHNQNDLGIGQSDIGAAVDGQGAAAVRQRVQRILSLVISLAAVAVEVVASLIVAVGVDAVTLIEVAHGPSVLLGLHSGVHT